MTYAIVYNIKYKICINMYKYLGGLFPAGPRRAFFGPGLSGFCRAGPTGRAGLLRAGLGLYAGRAFAGLLRVRAGLGSFGPAGLHGPPRASGQMVTPTPAARPQQFNSPTPHLAPFGVLWLKYLWSKGSKINPIGGKKTRLDFSIPATP